jgi:hypothetical protein
MEPSGSQSNYQAFVLRIWQEDAASSPALKVWRFSLQDTRTGQRHGFANIEAVNAFLEKMMKEEDGVNR